MYEYLSGTIESKSPTSVVLDVGGVGYHALISLTTYGALPEVGQSVKLRIHFIVREDAHSLYGFSSEEERELFRQLISVSGIGPKLAMTILSGRSIEELKSAIIEGSLGFLTGISGIGRKTGERIIVELREKIVIEDPAAARRTFAGKAPANMVVEDSLRALVELGYRRQPAKDAIDKVLQERKHETLSVPELIRASLKYF